MRNLMKTDAYRMFAKRWFWLCTLFMEGMALLFLWVQSSAMDYIVSLDRVIFLPMAFYGVAAAAMIAMYVGEDFTNGFVKNKVIAGHSKRAIYMSGYIMSALACMGVYTICTLTTITIGSLLFTVNVSALQILGYYTLGLFTCLSYAGIFYLLVSNGRNKIGAIVVCMMLAFAMLFLCLHTNQIMIQEALKDGVPNPAYVTGAKKIIYELLHDINPSGQAAQLSAMHCFNAVRYLAMDLLWLAVTLFGGAAIFKRKDIT